MCRIEVLNTYLVMAFLKLVLRKYNKSKETRH